METNRIFPDNWRDVIRGKKVILYNTGVTSLLQGRETRIEKMKWVFDVFKEHPEVVLWWRPHPLEVSTVHSMLPELEEQYMEVRRQYVEEDIGILDESADLNRAIAISDAYYGAWSSVVELYKVTGKPLMLSNDIVLEAAQEVGFGVVDFVIDGEFMWFVSGTMNLLFRMNLNSFVIEEIVEIAGYKVFDANAIRFIIKVENVLLLIPGWGKYLISYNLDTKVFRKLDVGKHTRFNKYNKVYCEKEKIYLLPTNNTEQVGVINVDNFVLQWEKSGKYDYSNMVIKEETFCGQEELYTVSIVVKSKKYMFSSIKNVWKIIDIDTGFGYERKMVIKDELKEIILSRLLFESSKCLTTDNRSFYGGESKWVYTLPRYIEAVINYTMFNVIQDVNLCGNIIYQTMIKDK